MEIDIGDIYVCRVKKLLQHGIIVEINNSEKEGFVHISELSKRWVRDVKNVAKEGDRIVCKVLKIGPLSVELSAKRITDNEKKQALREWSIDNRMEKLLEKRLGSGAQIIISKIKGRYGSLYEFYSSVMKNGKDVLLDLKLNKEVIEDILSFIEKTKRKITIRTELTIQNFGESGVSGIKELLGEEYAKREYYKIRYIKAPQYLLTVNADDTKKTISENKKILDGLEKKCKELGIKFAYKELKR